MQRHLFEKLGRFVSRYHWSIIVIAVALTIASAVYAAKTIRLNSDLDDLVSEKLDYHKRYKDFLREFGDQEYLYVVTEIKGDLPRAKQFVRALAARLEGMPDLSEVTWRITNPVLERSFMLYLTPKEIDAISGMTTKGAFAISNIAGWDSFVPLFDGMNEQVSGPVDPKNEAELSAGFSFIDGLIDSMIGALTVGQPYESKLQSLFFGENSETFDTEGFLKNGDLLFMLVMPKKDYSTMEVIAKPLGSIRAAIEETKKEYPGIVAGLTGRPVLSADEMATTNRDMTHATALSLVLVSIFFISFFRSATRPLLAIISLVMGISWTFGMIALVFGQLTVLSSVFALILIGASVEYAIYIVARYQEELARGAGAAGAIEKSLATAGRADFTSALTTAGAFLTIMWTDFTALAELGAIAAFGIFVCFAAMLIVLPAMMNAVDRRGSKASLAKAYPFRVPGLMRLYRHPYVIIGCGIALTAFLVPFALRTGFDNNLLKLQAEGLESVQFERLIIDKSSETTWFANAVYGTMDESAAKAEEFRKLGSVRRVDDISRILPTDQREKIKKVKAMAPAFASVHWAQPGDRIDKDVLVSELSDFKAQLSRLMESAFSSGRADAVDELEKFSAKLSKLIDLIEGAGPYQLAKLGELQRDFLQDLKEKLQILASGMDPVQITLNDLPASLVSRYKSPSGKFAIYIYPKEDIWDPAALSRFVAEMNTVDAKSLGTPIEVHESGRMMRRTFATSAFLAFGLIVLIVFLDFRKPRAAIMALFPLLTGTLWLVGFMGLFGVSFNMANFFAIPILIGTGIDNGIQVVHRIRKDGELAGLGASTGRGFILTALCQVSCFGTMMLTHHRGLASLGLIMTMGSATCLLAALILMPPIASYIMKVPLRAGR